jgi:hypothetical protein
LVVVTRDGREWRAEIPDLGKAHRTASLVRVDEWIRALLGPGWVNYEFHTGNAELDRRVDEVRAARRSAKVAEEQARRATRRLVADASRHINLSMRDLAVLLGLSHQRIQQLGTGRPGDR